jgi:sulfane dehydrogenase subunit SoxC
VVRQAGPSQGISKPLRPEHLVDHRPEETAEPPDDPTGDRSLNAETRWEAMAGTGYLTPTDRFFVRNHAPTPILDAAPWRLRVEGPGVERPFELGYDELLRLPSVKVVRALECAGNGRAFFGEVQGRAAEGTPWRLGAIGVAEWEGVPLREVLERAGLKGSAREVLAEGLDAVRVRRPLPLEKALEDALVVFGMNGEPLLPDHGFPVRLLVPGWAAVASIKWLGRLHVSEAPVRTPWNTDRYVMTGGTYGERREPVTGQVVKSALELPWPARLRRGVHTLTGRSWSPDAAIARVEYAVDGDPEWWPAELFRPNLPGAWVRWRFAWEAVPGEHGIRVRAADALGRVQPEWCGYNELGYLYGGVVEHPVRVS